MNYIDVHAHLNDPKYGGNLSEILEDMRLKGVTRVINSGYDMSSTAVAADISDKNKGIYFTAGIHPDDAKTMTDEYAAQLKKYAEDPCCVGIGETGFDFYWNKSTEEEQERAFETQMAIACETGLPFVVHSRNACKKTLDFLKSRKDLIKREFLLHCYSESAECVKEFCDLGASFSLGGVVTFKNAKKAEVIRAIPLDRLLSETDSPYLSPEPFRGTVNTPANVIYVVRKFAEVKGVSEEKMNEIINENAERLFPKLTERK